MQFVLGIVAVRDNFRPMSSLAQEVDATLEKLDPPAARRFERLVRDAVAAVCPSENSSLAPSLDQAYFDSVVGAFADLPFERPAQGDLPSAKVW